LAAAIDSGAKQVIVGLAACDFFDSSALAVVITASQRLETRSARLSLITADPNIRKVFEITGFDGMFAFHPTRAEALNGGGSLNELTRDELVRRLADVSHATYLPQKARKDPPADPTGQESTPHDYERAEDTVHELERLASGSPRI
jgi:hypothetical protein